MRNNFHTTSAVFLVGTRVGLDFPFYSVLIIQFVGGFVCEQNLMHSYCGMGNSTQHDSHHQDYIHV